MAGAVNVINAGDVPVYWKNKVQHELEAEFKKCDYCKATPKDISVVNNNVIAVGDYYDESDFVDNYIPMEKIKQLYGSIKTLQIMRMLRIIVCKISGSHGLFKNLVEKLIEAQTCSSSSLQTKESIYQTIWNIREDISSDITPDNSEYLPTGYTDGAFDGNSNKGKEDFFLIKYVLVGKKMDKTWK